MEKIVGQVEEYLEYCEKVRRMSNTTMAMKRNVLTRFVGVVGCNSLEELTNAAFNDWVKHETDRELGNYRAGSGRKVNARSVNAYNAVVLAMVRYYRGIGMHIPLNLTLVGKLHEGGARRKYYTAEEIAVVVSKADFVTGLMIMMMFETGMRIAEICRLRLSDFEGRRIRFVGKGRKQREVYVTASTLIMLRQYVDEYGVTGYLWAVREGAVTLNGEPPTVNTVRTWLARAFYDAGFPDFYPHALRHSFATDLQLRGASVAEIKEMIGHSSVATTERYLHGFDGRLAELFEKYRGQECGVIVSLTRKAI